MQARIPTSIKNMNLHHSKFLSAPLDHCFKFENSFYRKIMSPYKVSIIHIAQGLQEMEKMSYFSS